jgi:hypothetical protein
MALQHRRVRSYPKPKGTAREDLCSYAIKNTKSAKSSGVVITTTSTRKKVIRTKINTIIQCQLKYYAL